MAEDLHVFAVPGIPEVVSGADLGRLIADAVRSGDSVGRAIRAGDVFVVAQKIVSKAEDAVVRLDGVVPSPLAREWAAASGRDPRVVEVILGESRRIVRMDHGVLIAETHHGFVCANAGVDASNVPLGWVTVLPREPDASADRLREALSEAFECPIGVIVADTFGRPWREGLVNVALGVSGIAPLIDYRGQRDSHGNALKVTVIAIADELASAAELVMKKSAGVPVVVIRGFNYESREASGRELIRASELDLFR